MDKYDVAFALQHEMAAHVNSKADDEGRSGHEEYGNSVMPIGLSLYAKNKKGELTSEMAVRQGSSSWNFLKELFYLKIINGDATEQNIQDYKTMVQMDKK